MTHDSLEASVIIPNFNGSATLPDQLDALSRQDFPGRYEVIVADNGSTDASSDVVREWTQRFADLRLVDASGRRSASFARNRGASMARGNLLLFCDGDDVAAPGWISGMVKALDSSHLAGGRLDHCALNGNSSLTWSAIIQTSGLPKPSEAFFPYSGSCNFAIRKDAFVALGGWDESFDGASGEDVDLCWRAQLAGYRLEFAPEATVFYRHRKGLASLAKRNFSHARSNVLLYLRFRPYGYNPRSYVLSLKSWMWLLTRMLNLVRGPESRAQWVRVAATRMGRLSGSLRYRAFLP